MSKADQRDRDASDRRTLACANAAVMASWIDGVDWIDESDILDIRDTAATADAGYALASLDAPDSDTAPDLGAIEAAAYHDGEWIDEWDVIDNLVVVDGDDLADDATVDGEGATVDDEGAADAATDSEETAGELDALGRVREVETAMAALAAERLVRVDALHREALADAGDDVHRFGSEREIVERSLRLELACALRVSEYAADRLVTLADAIVNRYPLMLEALAHAEVTQTHAQVLADELDPLDPDIREDVTDLAVDMARRLPVQKFRRGLRKLLEAARSDTLTERHEHATKARRAWIEGPGRDGMAAPVHARRGSTRHLRPRHHHGQDPRPPHDPKDRFRHEDRHQHGRRNGCEF